jgi:hypothetical protein
MRFELLRPHTLTIDGINRLVDTGTVVDGSTVPGFCPTPAMKPLDPDAHAWLIEVLNRIRRTPGGDHVGGMAPGQGKNVPGFGSLLGHPGGELEGR